MTPTPAAPEVARTKGAHGSSLAKTGAGARRGTLFYNRLSQISRVDIGMQWLSRRPMEALVTHFMIARAERRLPTQLEHSTRTDTLPLIRRPRAQVSWRPCRIRTDSGAQRNGGG